MKQHHQLLPILVSLLFDGSFLLYSEMDKNEIGYKKYLYYSIIIKIIVGGCIVKGKAHK